MDDDCSGHYAVVCRGKCKRTGRAVAVKKIKRFLTDPHRLTAEISVLRRVTRHPNIVQLLDVFETAREVQLVLELCTGGELFERLADKGAYSEADCVRHVRDMASAVRYLHQYVYRSLGLLSMASTDSVTSVCVIQKRHHPSRFEAREHPAVDAERRRRHHQSGGLWTRARVHGHCASDQMRHVGVLGARDDLGLRCHLRLRLQGRLVESRHHPVHFVSVVVRSHRCCSHAEID